MSRHALLAVLLNGLVFLNALLHDPAVGYDARQHLRYVAVLSQGRLPGPEDTSQFFSPPLPYALPALLVSFFGLEARQAAKAAQIGNALLSLALTFALLKLCEVVNASDPALKASALLLLAMFPVYYKSFAFVRGEPFVALFAVLAALLAARMVLEDRSRPRDAAALGAVLGLLVLGRQWGFLVLPALLVFLGVEAFRKRERRRRLLFATGAALALAAALAGWFYGYLWIVRGSVTAFNRPPAAVLSPANQPREFYLDLGLGRLFRDPVSDAFPNRLLPIFYSETWGDYWGFFLIYGHDARSGQPVSGGALDQALARRPGWFETNRERMSGYLGRVNLAALVPSILCLVGFAAGAVSLARYLRGSQRGDDIVSALATLIVASSLAGYLGFLIAFPNPGKGDTIKATYVLHIFPFLALLGGRLLARMRLAAPRGYRLLVALLILVLLHNLPAMVTRNTRWI